MLIYWLLLAGSVLIGYPLCKLKFGKEIYCVLMGFALFFVAAVRQGVGHDYNSYGQMYIDFQSLDIDDIAVSRIEKGFGMPMKMLSNLFTDYHILFYVTSFIIAAAIMTYIYIKSEHAYLSVFCFIAIGEYFVTMDFLRQVLAALIMVYALQYVHKKQFLRFLAFTLLAFTFHVSALIMLVFYFILQIKMNYVTLGIYSAVTVLFFIFSWDIMDFVTDYVYKSYDPATSIEMKGGIDPIYSVFFSFFFIGSFIFRKALVEKDPENNVYINCMFFAFFFGLCGAKHAIISRFSILFAFPAVVILIPRLVAVIVEKCGNYFRKKRIGRTVPCAVFLAFFFALCASMYGYMLATNYNGVVPYVSIYSEGGAK